MSKTYLCDEPMRPTGCFCQDCIAELEVRAISVYSARLLCIVAYGLDVLRVLLCTGALDIQAAVFGGGCGREAQNQEGPQGEGA